MAGYGPDGVVPRCYLAAAARRLRDHLQLHNALHPDPHAVKALLIGAFAGWLSGCAIMPTRGPIPVGEATLYVVERGWHTDIGLSVEEVSRPLASLEEDFPGVRFMVFGF